MPQNAIKEGKEQNRKKYWIKNIPSLCIPLGFIAIGVTWLHWIPGTGKAASLLGVGAALMPIFWEKSKKWARSIWIAMLFLLLAVEYRAIAQDRQEFAEQFNKLLTEERNILGEERGGDGYPWIVPANPRESFYPPQFDGTGKWALFAENLGSAPLRDVILQIQECPTTGDSEPTKLGKARRHSVIQLGVLWSSAYGDYSLSYGVQPGCYVIISSTRVTGYTEYLLLPPVDSHQQWQYAIVDSKLKVLVSTFPSNVRIGNLPPKP